VAKEEKKEPVNTQPKSFVEELKSKAEGGAVKPSEFKKKGRKKKTEIES